jgi:hypothetical protein
MDSIVNTTFNGPIELGTRTSLILTCMEQKLSLDNLILLDYALLYSEDFCGPENLHPALPNHIAEIGHRREFLPPAIAFFSKRGLIDIHHEASGHYYSANSQTLNFVSCLNSNYYKKIWIRLNWLQDNLANIIDKTFPKYKVSANDY